MLFVLAVGDRALPARSPERFTEVTSDPHERVRSRRESYAAEFDEDGLFTGAEGVVEVLIAPRSTPIGRRVSAGMTTRDENLVVLALRRGNSALNDRAASGALTLQAGDSVLVRGAWDALHRYTRSPDVIAVEASQRLQRNVPLGRGWRRALVVLVVAVGLLATSAVPPVIAGILAAAALALLRVITVPQGFRSISWDAIVLIAALIPMSAAFVSSGLADAVAMALMQVTGSGSPHATLFAGYHELEDGARPAGDAERRAIAIAGDREDDLDIVASFVDALGFDALRIGDLSSGGRLEPGTAAFGANVSIDRLRDLTAGPLRGPRVADRDPRNACRVRA